MTTDFVDWLNNELRKRDMTPADLARGSNLDKGVISRILNRERNPSQSTLVSISDGLRVLPDTVFRAAGLLPPIPERDAALEEALYILATLSDEDLQEMIAIAKLKQERKSKTTGTPTTPKSRKKSPARGVLKDK